MNKQPAPHLTLPASFAVDPSSDDRVADIAARTLHNHGVRLAFGMPGGEVVTFVDALEKAGIRFVLARHETAAAFMAAGSSVTHAAPGLLVTTVGPGLTNALNGIADAAQEHVPLIVVSGVVDHALRHRYTHQVYDQADLVRPMVKASLEVEDVGVGATMARAIRLAMRAPAGPVHVDLAPGTAAKPAGSSDNAVLPALPVEVRPLRLDSMPGGLAQMMSDASRPVIIAGMGAIQGQGPSQVVALAETLQAPVITTYKAKGVIRETDHPLSLGAAGLSPRADALLLPFVGAADLVILAGYDPIEMRPGWLDPFGKSATVVDLCDYPADHAMHTATHRVIGPLEDTLHACINGIAAHRATVERPKNGAALPVETSPAGRLGDGLKALKSELEQAFAPPTQWGPHAVIDDLQAALDNTTTITVDSGAHRILLSQMLRVWQPRQLQQSAGFCTMGTALPSAIGIKMADPDRHVIAVLGDGGLEMGLGELATLRDTQTAVTIVVFQDESLALIELKQDQAGLACNGVRLGATPFEDIATAYGGVGIRVASCDALADALKAARSCATFTLIACTLEAQDYVDRI